MLLPMLLQTCRHNFLDKVKINLRAVKAHTWKDLVEQAEIAEKLAKKFKLSVPKNKWGVNTKGHDAAQFYQQKRKESIVVELSRVTQPKQKSVLAEIRKLSFRQRSTLSKTSIW